MSNYVEPVTLPIFLADAINSANPSKDGFFVHILQTEVGEKRFEIPGSLVRSEFLYPAFDRLRYLINAGFDAAEIMEALKVDLVPISLSVDELGRLECTIDTLVDLHRQEWDGIWCPILADRFAAGSIPEVTHIAGNPPWVKWSHLPPPYAKFIKPICRTMNVFSVDHYVGGIESDISTVITFQAVMKWLAPRGRLAFFITATVFANESSQGFRRFASHDGIPLARFTAVEDFKAVAPFDGVTNHAALMFIEEGVETVYPVPYRVWSPRRGERAVSIEALDKRDLLAAPVPGSDAGPWLKGTKEQHELWANLFDASQVAHYRARKGITTDLNGVYFVRVENGPRDCVWVTNDPSCGRKDDLPQIRRLIEKKHVFPLMRGRGLNSFRANIDPNYKVIVPQRAMHGDATLPINAPRTYQFFLEFKEWLVERGSYRRYQAQQPFWSTWSTGPYTFSEYKVLWNEMSGAHFCAGYIRPIDDPVLGRRVVVPDHKLYFVPVSTLEEAQYLTAILNAPLISSAIGGYAAQLSLGTSVIENLTIPKFNPADQRHTELAQIANEIAVRDGETTKIARTRLDALAKEVVMEHGAWNAPNVKNLS